MVVHSIEMGSPQYVDRWYAMCRMLYCPLQVQEALLCFAVWKSTLWIWRKHMGATPYCSGRVLPTDLAVEEHPEGGANALNLNRCFLSLSLTYIGPWSQNPHDTNGTKQFPVMSIIESSSFLIIWLLCSASAPSYTGCQVELSTQRSYRMQVPWWITCWKRALHLCNKRVRAVAVTASSGSLALVECNNCRLRQQLRRTQLKLKKRKGLMVLQLGVKKPLKHLIGAWSQYETGYFQGRRWEHIHTSLYCLFQSAVCHFGFGFLTEFVKALLCALLTSSLTACR